MSTRKPNLFVVGSTKAGTTSLARYLGTHPEMFMTSDPVVGEASANYARLPRITGVPERRSTRSTRRSASSSCAIRWIERAATTGTWCVSSASVVTC